MHPRWVLAGCELVAEQILQLVAELRLRPGTGCRPRTNWLRGWRARGSVVCEAVKILPATGRVRAQKGRGIHVAPTTISISGVAAASHDRFLVASVREARRLRHQASAIHLDNNTLEDYRLEIQRHVFG